MSAGKSGCLKWVISVHMTTVRILMMLTRGRTAMDTKQCLTVIGLLVLLLPTQVLPEEHRPLDQGGTLAGSIQLANLSGQPGITMQSSDATGVEIHYGMDSFEMVPVSMDGETLHKIALPGVFLPNDAGAPDLPGMGWYVAVPQGATASLTILSTRSSVYNDVDIAPAPVIPLDSDHGPLVYERDLSIYGRDLLYPGNPVVVSESGVMRGVDVITVGITPFQYNPARKELLVYTEIDLRIDFSGGTGRFGGDALRNRYWEPILQGLLLNYEMLPSVDLDGSARSGYGYEYVVISPDDPDFVAWGDTLKTWRTRQGIRTEVFTTTDIGGTSWTTIRDWLHNAYHNWDTKPVAFLILGDHPSSGLKSGGIEAPMWNSIVSDNVYADADGDDDLPDMVHGRITARNAAELQTMIGKMLSYERNPPTDPGFYEHPIVTGGWQTERWFILCSEVVQGFLTSALDKQPVREYAIYSGTPGSQWSIAPNTETIIDYFGPNGLGYIPATPGHLTDWGGNATRINNAINSGAFLVLHRDHGGVTGWGEPDYDIGDLSGLQNDMCPFVFSINCLTGKYNSAGECLTEAFHRMACGSLGLVAASEVSYSFVNDTFVWGMFDGLWPEFIPDYSGDSDSELRTAFAMAYGKYFLQQSSWPYNAERKQRTYHLFHHHGDAFMTLHSEVPQELTVVHDGSCPCGVGFFTVQADEDAVICLTVGGEIVGLATGTGAPQDIVMIPQTEPGTMCVTATKPNHLRYEADVPMLHRGIWYILPDGSGDAPTIQAGIECASAGDTVLVACGTYYEHDIVMKSGVCLRSETGQANCVTIDAQEQGRVFYWGGLDTTTSIEGFTMVNGCADAFGGGIYCDASSPRVLDCILSTNRVDGSYAAYGGGMYCCNSSSPSLTHCAFCQNRAGSFGAEAYGGGIYCSQSSPTIEASVFSNNAAEAACRFCCAFGGGMYCHDSSPTISGCSFCRNVAFAIEGGGRGAGFCLDGSSSPAITHCILYENSAKGAFDGGLGGAVYCGSGSAEPSLGCCDLYGNTAGYLGFEAPSDWVGCIADQQGMNGNFSAHPAFCDANGSDFHLRPCSPCLDASGCGLIGALGAGCPGTRTWYVPEDAPTIQAGIDMACAGDSVVVASGTYHEHDIVMKSGITLRSETGLPDCVTIGADSLGRVFHCSGVDSATVIGGFTITGGSAVDGGGVFCETSSLALVHCNLSGNSAARRGGGFYCIGGGPRISHCTFSDNAAWTANDSYGGAVYCSGCSAMFTDCAFLSNWASYCGGGLQCQSSSATVSRCTFLENSANYGGGVYCSTCSPVVSNCVFVDNSAYGGGGISSNGGSPTLTSCTFTGNSAGLQGGGGICCSSGSTPAINHCTFFGNSAPSGGGVYAYGGASPQLEEAIIAFGLQGEAVYCHLTGSATLTCCDVYGNAGGDWVGYIADQYGIDGNISADPQFCDAAGDDYHLRSTSPCLYGPCGQIGAFGQGCVSELPRIMSILDVGNDQGRQVRIRWQRSLYDAPDDTVDITGYGIYRRQDQFLKACSGGTTPSGIAKSDGGRLDGWDYVETVPARADSIYQFVAATLCDSTMDAGICWSTFLVSAVTPEPPIYFDSAPDSGYSVDNLAPGAPQGLAAEYGAEGIVLIWDANLEEDLDYYAVYRGTEESFEPDTPIGYSTTETYADEDLPGSGQYWYKVTATDFGGNESEPSLPASASMSSVDAGSSAVPTAFFLGQATPNPFNPVTEISYGIPAGSIPSRVVMKVYDATGREVKTLVDAEQGPGVHRAVWNGTDQGGTPVASGVYFYRITWNRESKNGRMVLLK